MEIVGAGLDRGIENGGTGASEFRAEVRSLDLEFLHSIDRRKNHIVCAVQEIYGVRIVVDPIEHVIVLRRPKAIGREGAVGRIAPRIRLWRVHTRDYLRQESKISPVEREIIHAARVDHLTYGSVLGFEQGSGSRHFHGLRYIARSESKIRDHVCTDVHCDAALRNCLEALQGGAEFVAPDSDRREFVGTIGSRGRAEARTRPLIRECHGGAVDHCPRGIGNRPQDGTGVHLSTYGPRG